RNLVREPRGPELARHPIRHILPHHFERPLGRVDAHAWEALCQRLGAEPVSAMPMRDVDVRDFFPEALDPVSERFSLLDGDRRIDQHGFGWTVAERTGYRRPHLVIAIGKERR